MTEWDKYVDDLFFDIRHGLRDRLKIDDFSQDTHNEVEITADPDYAPDDVGYWCDPYCPCGGKWIDAMEPDDWMSDEEYENHYGFKRSD